MINEQETASNGNWVAWVQLNGQEVKVECDLYHRLPVITLNGEPVHLIAVQRVFFMDTTNQGVDYIDFAGCLNNDEKLPNGMPKMRTFRYDFKSGDIFEWNIGATEEPNDVEEEQ